MHPSLDKHFAYLSQNEKYNRLLVFYNNMFKNYVDSYDIAVKQTENYLAQTN